MDKKTNLNRCPLCGGRAINGMYGISGYFMCNDCLLGWKKTLKSTEYLTEYYKGKSSLATFLFVPLRNFFYSVRQSYVGTGKKKLWIDVGAGEGGFLKTVSVKKRIGVEVSNSGRKMMEKAGLSTLTDKKFLKTKGLQADVISFWHMLEHVENPSDYLISAKSNLKKSGVVVIGIPNIDSFEFKFARQYWFHLQPQFHLWHFTPNSIRKLLEKSGYSINSIDHWSVEHHLTGVLQSFINKTSISKENVLHKLIKRGTGKSSVKPKDIFWSVLWVTIGSPIIISFWVLGSVFKKGGTFVVVAEPKK